MQKLRWMTIVGVGLVMGCEAGEPAGLSPLFSQGAGSNEARASGGGHYDISGLIVQFDFNASVKSDGRTQGHLRHRVQTEDGQVDFHGDVTCLAVDPVNHRAWIGGVITQNNSTDPAFLVDTLHAVGLDIWFRVVDYGEGGAAPPDRTTFTGFKHSAGFLTSADYCAGRPWPAGDARTWPVTGNLQVRP